VRGCSETRWSTLEASSPTPSCDASSCSAAVVGVFEGDVDMWKERLRPCLFESDPLKGRRIEPANSSKRLISRRDEEA